jgi:pectate lyase
VIVPAKSTGTLTIEGCKYNGTNGTEVSIDGVSKSDLAKKIGGLDADGGAVTFPYTNESDNAVTMKVVVKSENDTSNVHGIKYSVEFASSTADELKTLAIGGYEEYKFKDTGKIFNVDAPFTGDVIYSPNGYIALHKGNLTNGFFITAHGLTDKNSDGTVQSSNGQEFYFEVIVPGNTTGTFTIGGCKSNENTAYAKVNGTTVVEAKSIRASATCGEPFEFTYNNTSSDDVRMQIYVIRYGSTRVNDIKYEVKTLDTKQWSSNKEGTVTIGDTTFDVKAGSSKDSAFDVSVKSGTGYVEKAGTEKAVVWSNLGGKSVTDVVTAGTGFTTSVGDNKVTLTYTDTTSYPEGYVLEVRDSSKAAAPEQDGKTITYNLTDGSVLSDLYAGVKIGSATITSEDGNLILKGSNISYNDTTHGVTVNSGDTISVKVAGNAKIELTGSSFQEAAAMSISSESGTFYESGDSTKAVQNITIGKINPYPTKTFLYEGSATTLTFTFKDATSYVREIKVTNYEPAVPESEVNTSAAKVVPQAYNFDKGTLEPTRVGQKITLGSTISFPSANIATSGLGIYAFPLTKDNNTLSVDVLIDSCGSSDKNAVMVGLFSLASDTGADRVKAVTTGVRNSSNEVVQLMSKSSTESLGKNSFSGYSGTISAGDVVTITISRDGDNVIQTIKNKTTGSEVSTMTTTYEKAAVGGFSPSGEVYYGIMVANRTVKVTNMKYTDSNGTVLYDQNTYYNPAGTAPNVTGVTAEAASDRTKFTVTWTGDKAIADGKFVLQVKKPGASDFVEVDDEITEQSYDYPVVAGESGDYVFRVCGTLGNSDEQNTKNRNTWAVSSLTYIYAALAIPEVTLDLSSTKGKAELSWTASSGATSYQVMRRSDGDGAEYVKIAEVLTTSYTDTAVEDNTVYYYKVVACATGNHSPDSDEKWTLVSKGYTGDYDEDVALFVTKRSYNTVFDGKLTIEGVAGASGTVTLSVDGTRKDSASVASANGTFAFSDVQLSEGRHAVELELEYGDGLTVRKVLNYVYLTNYDIVVDAGFTGTNGTADINGKPQYKTVAAAIAAASKDNVILVRNGDYNEKLNISTSGLHIIGEDSEKTRIYYSVCEGNKTKDSDKSRYAITLNSGASDFTFENITLENSWEYDGTGNVYSNESAEALYSEAANTVLVGVRLMSYQDTIQSKNNKMYLYRCYVAGNVDFMWGVSTTVLYDDCDIVFRYNANKNSGYYTAYGKDSDVVYNNCRFTSEENCGGTKYYLGRPYNNETKVTLIDCYMGSVINDDYGWATWGGKELTSDETTYAKALFYESGSYGASTSVNLNRRQLSQSTAHSRLAAMRSSLDCDTKVSELGQKYIGSLSLAAGSGSVTNAYSSGKYSWYDGDDTGLGKYELEGFAESAGTSGGGLLKESNSNYYKVSNGTEFLDALTEVYNKKGVPSVIEVTADLNLGSNEVDLSKYSSNIAVAHSHQALVNPSLQESGVSKVYIKSISNLTIFSGNGSTIKHAALDISGSTNIIIRNLAFDELWEWDEETAGDYDVNDWDYMTIENSSTKVWVDHCTFYKAYDGIIDIKAATSTTSDMDVTVSWCEFQPGSKNNTFFNAMMDYLDENKDSMPYYKSLLDSGMSREQIWWYAYGQKKTHLLGQSDDASANEYLKVTFANNYYYDSMDRMPRLRFGTAHIYNSIMDAQELLEARMSISNAAAAKHIVSNGASSTCDGQLLVESCYINGIQNALNSGNGSSPSGYIAASKTLYYVNGIRYAAIPKVNTTKEGEQLKVTDATQFVANLPYSGNYKLYDAAELATVVKPYTGAGKLDLTVLQWEKASYNTDVDKTSEAKPYENDLLPEYQISKGSGSSGNDDDDTQTTVTTTDSGVIAVGESVGVIIPAGTIIRDMYGNIVTSGQVFVKAAEKSEEGRLRIEDAMAGQGIVFGEGVGVDYYEVTFVDANGNPLTFEGSLLVTFKFPEGTGMTGFNFKVMHLLKSGVLDVMDPTVTEAGVTVSVTELSPFAVAYVQGDADSANGIVTTVASAPTGDRAPIVPLVALMVVCLGVVGVGVYVTMRKKGGRAE